MTTTIHSERDGHDKVGEVFIGRSVTKVDDDTLTLDDGTVVHVEGNWGCGGCANGNYEITHLGEHPNVITAVEWEQEFTGGEYSDQEAIRMFVLSFPTNERTLLIQAEGHDNGYYGTGFWIELKR